MSESATVSLTDISQILTHWIKVSETEIVNKYISIQYCYSVALVISKLLSITQMPSTAVQQYQLSNVMYKHHVSGPSDIATEHVHLSNT